eukprot:scaffold70187_cov60-Phaeocystis_antarctica.AAC.1
MSGCTGWRGAPGSDTSAASSKSSASGRSSVRSGRSCSNTGRSTASTTGSSASLRSYRLLRHSTAPKYWYSRISSSFTATRPASSRASTYATSAAVASGGTSPSTRSTPS